VGVANKTLKTLSVQQAAKLGIHHLPCDRATQGIIREFTGRENLTLGTLHFNRLAWWVPRRRERQVFSDWTSRLDISPNNPELPMPLFSGGNQQKILLGRVLQGRPSVLVLDQPTVGVDVHARSRIFDTIRGWTREGLAVLVCSNDLEELTALCDRVIVLKAGRAVAEFRGSQVKEENLVPALVGFAHVA
jgi:ribose transport system ATP-binding protein